MSLEAPFNLPATLQTSRRTFPSSNHGSLSPELIGALKEENVKERELLLVLCCVPMVCNAVSS